MLSFTHRVCVYMCVCERDSHSSSVVCVCVCVCSHVWERETRSHNRALWANIYELLQCLSHDCSPLGLELMVKLRSLLTVFTLVWKAEAHDYGKGSYNSDAACGVRPITMHWFSWPIRADCACRKEGLKWPIIMYSIWKIMCFLNIKACQHILLHQIMIFKKASYDPFIFSVLFW